MTVAEALHSSVINRTEAEVLMAALLDCDRTMVLAHPERELDSTLEKKFIAWVGRRKRLEPIAHIVGEKEFYGRMFYVDPSVLIPRPATEGLVEMALEIMNSHHWDSQSQCAGRGTARRAPTPQIKTLDEGILGVANIWGDVSDVKTIVDIGTGSGCIAVTLALERPDLKIIATDVCEETLDVAEKNAKRWNISISRYPDISANPKNFISFLLGNLLDPIQDFNEPFLIISNPPYIPEGTRLMKEVHDFEPHTALFAGHDGLSVIQPLINGAKKHPWCRGIILEILNSQFSILNLQ
jgi:release factor glutamine methyltransferase